jgi:hypothetical protein
MKGLKEKDGKVEGLNEVEDKSKKKEMRMKGLKEKNKIRNTNQRKKRMYLTLVPV